MKTLLIAAFAIAGLTAPVIAQPPEHAPAHGYRRNLAEGHFHHRFEERYADRDFRYYDRACATTTESAIGAVLGSLAGEAALGARLGLLASDCDRAQYGYAAREAFDRNDPAYFRNPETGLHGVIQPGDAFRRDGRDCRRGEAEFFTPDGGYETDGVVLCRDGRGGWEIAG